MKITQTKDRVVTLEEREDGFLLVERIRYVPRGYVKAKWDETRIWLSPEEFAKVKEFGGTTGAAR